MPSIYAIIDESKLSIRKGTWAKNEGINIDQKVIEQTIKELELKTCPVCKGSLESRDQFGTHLNDPRMRETKIMYCPKDNYIIELTAHKYKGNVWGTNFIMKIHTNAMISKKLAHSGVLADLRDQHVELKY